MARANLIREYSKGGRGHNRFKAVPSLFVTLGPGQVFPEMRCPDGEAGKAGNSTIEIS